MRGSTVFYLNRFIFTALFLSGISLVHTLPVEPKELRTIKIAYIQRDDLQNDSSLKNHRSGHAYEFLQNVAYFAGWKYEYINTNPSDGILMLENGGADIIAQILKNPEREQKCIFPICQ